MQAYAVIGANYGDEGKGLVTDYLSREHTTVIRFNGGAQAGHTVVTPNGERHVFSHFGAGSFRGARTFLSKYFVINPMVFQKELEELRSLGLAPIVHADLDCLVTTPYDIFFNEEVERFRGNTRHGSCGIGFGSTVETSEETSRLNALRSFYYWTNTTINTIRNSILVRMNQLKIPLNKERLEYYDSTIPVFKEMVDRLFEYVRFATPSNIQHVVFEGAQGLLLDQNHRNFPHVTRSNTGLTNVVKLCRRFGINKLTSVFVSRCYLTRHGNGPMEETVIDENLGIIDETNIPNEFQGSLRFAPIDYGRLVQRVESEVAYFERQIDLSRKYVITHLDQSWKLGKYGNMYGYKGPFNVPRKDVMTSYGPTRNNICEH